MISKKEREYIAKLETAVKASLAWLDKFGEHAPIAFGGEQELHDTLQEALASKPTQNYAMLYLQVSAQNSVYPTALCAGHSGGSIAKEGICQECGLPIPHSG